MGHVSGLCGAPCHIAQPRLGQLQSHSGCLFGVALVKPAAHGACKLCFTLLIPSTPSSLTATLLCCLVCMSLLDASCAYPVLILYVLVCVWALNGSCASPVLLGGA